MRFWVSWMLLRLALTEPLGSYELKVYNNKEIQSVLGVNEKLLRRYRYDGKLSYTKVGDKYWYTQDDIDEFMAKHHRKAFA